MNIQTPREVIDRRQLVSALRALRRGDFSATKGGIFDPDNDLPNALARTRRAGAAQDWGYISVRPYYRR